MNGSDVLKAREALGWKRPQLAAATGFTVAQVARMERSGPRRGEEEEKLKDVLRNELGRIVVHGTEGRLSALPPVLQSFGTAEQIEADPDAEVVLDEWHGLKHGDVVKLDRDIAAGKRTTFVFLRYRKTSASEWVEVRASNGGIRTVRPEAVHVRRKGKWVRP